MSKQTDHNTIDKIQSYKHELEIECIELEEQILALQNVLMRLQSTRQRFEKKVALAEVSGPSTQFSA